VTNIQIHISAHVIELLHSTWLLNLKKFIRNLFAYAKIFTNCLFRYFTVRAFKITLIEHLVELNVRVYPNCELVYLLKVHSWTYDNFSNTISYYTTFFSQDLLSSIAEYFAVIQTYTTNHCYFTITNVCSIQPAP
jgi:hypothetical protein